MNLYHIPIYTESTYGGSKVDSVLTICLLLGMTEQLLHYSTCQSASLALGTLPFHGEGGEGTSGTVLPTVAQGTLGTEQSGRSRFTQPGNDLLNREGTRPSGQKSLGA